MSAYLINREFGKIQKNGEELSDLGIINPAASPHGMLSASESLSTATGKSPVQSGLGWLATGWAQSQQRSGFDLIIPGPPSPNPFLISIVRIGSDEGFKHIRQEGKNGVGLVSINGFPPHAFSACSKIIENNS
jgi:hypothetical protein